MKQIEAALGASVVPEGIEEVLEEIPVRDGSTITARVHRPNPATNHSPLIVYYHLGGYCAGSSALEIPLCRSLVKNFDAVCVNVDYRLAPEHPFPTPINDCWDALKWAAAHAAELGADPTRGFIVGGESAGGNASIVLAHLARDTNLSPPLTGQFASLPYCLPPGTVPDKYKALYHSWEQSFQAPDLFLYDSIMITRKAHAPDMLSPLFGAFHHPDGHSALPPAYFQVCALDPFRDEGLVYEKVLREEYGIETRLDLYPGLPHAFWALCPRLKASEKARQDQVDAFGWLLSKTQEYKVTSE